MTKSQLLANLRVIVATCSHETAIDLIEANINEFCADLVRDIAEILSVDTDDI